MQANSPPSHEESFLSANRLRVVGLRQEVKLQRVATGDLLMAGTVFGETMAKLTPAGFMPKGLYRFKSHAEANEHQTSSLAIAMSQLALKRN